jgi:LmbE family N-acetylglucosaminyl deacetylase
MSDKPLKLMCILAHPDDESLATGGALAKYSAAGLHTSLLMATRGERGWFGEPADYPGPEALGRLREGELRAASRVLGLRELVFLGYRDGELDRARPAEAVARIVAHIRRIRPNVVVTFDPNGMYGHPDHIAISQLATTAVMAAADPSYCCPTLGPHHRVEKLYYRAFLASEQEPYEAAFGRLVMPVDQVERRFAAWPEWAITTRIDISGHWERIWQAIRCHRSQLPDLPRLRALPAEYHAHLWTSQTYYRAMSLVNGGREVEDDLFAGLTERAGSDRSIAHQPIAA